MFPTKPSYPKIASPEYSKTAGTQENNHKTNCMMKIQFLKEDMKNFLKDTKEKSRNYLEEINKSLNKYQESIQPKEKRKKQKEKERKKAKKTCEGNCSRPTIGNRSNKDCENTNLRNSGNGKYRIATETTVVSISYII